MIPTKWEHEVEKPNYERSWEMGNYRTPHWVVVHGNGCMHKNEHIYVDILLNKRHSNGCVEWKLN